MKKKMYLLTALVSVLTFAFIISSSIEAKVRISKKTHHTKRIRKAYSTVKRRKVRRKMEII